MYPPQTSLIPATVALVRFFETFGFAAFTKNYPYWYLGTTPYKFLTGPIIPIAVSSIHQMLKNISLFDISIYLIIFSWLISALGWVILFFKISEVEIKRSKKFVYGLFFVIVF